jgi:glyceraldehyde-3-phosphate dehydrogenase/erythrose-4-phosphate dehydrogenase
MSSDGDLAKRASLLRRDSIHGTFAGTISVDEENEAIQHVQRLGISSVGLDLQHHAIYQCCRLKVRFQYRRDSIHGTFAGTISVDEENEAIIANGNFIKVIYAYLVQSIQHVQRLGISSVGLDLQHHAIYQCCRLKATQIS